MPVCVEVCVTSVAEARVAEACGVDSVEVCSWLASGGVTPSSGLVDAVRSAVRIPTRVLVRPTPEGFHYDRAALHALLLDAEIFGGGAIGLVTGGLTGAGGMDRELMREVRHRAPDSELTFHRAIDHAADPQEVLDGCLDLGVERILTSGGASRAVEGLAMLKALVSNAGDRCMIAAAGGIGPDNVVGIVEQSGVREVHFAAQRTSAHPVHRIPLTSGHAPSAFGVEPDQAKIEGVLNALVKAGLR